jgi:single-strand DNA-binding protein
MHVTTIIGNVGRDPEVKELKNGSRVANLSVAVNEYRGKDEEPAVFWYTITAWNQFADIAENLGKGDRVVVVGKMVTRKWEDKDGNDRYSTELVVDGWNGALAEAPAPEQQQKKKASSSRRRDDDDEDEAPRRSSGKKPSRRREDDDDDDMIPF